MTLTPSDILTLQKAGITTTKAEQQIQQLKEGLPTLMVEAAATAPNDILRLNDEDQKRLVALFESTLEDATLRVAKFVPASGAASRMFKALLTFLGDEAIRRWGDEVDRVVSNLQRFPFYDALNTLCLKETGEDIDALKAHHRERDILRLMLLPEGLNLSNQPKGVLPFHSYEEGTRTPVAEHIVEALAYAAADGKKPQLHFTISPEHEELFVQAIREAKDHERVAISHSFQKASTNTLALDAEGNLFRTEQGELLLRPGGHGALIENLSELDADIVFVKNIDNVVPDHLKEPTIHYKKVLGGLLVSLRQRCFQWLARVEQEALSESLLQEAEQFVRQDLHIGFTTASTLSERKAFLQTILNRPIRVCGMVKNEGEPGGGPFLVKNDDGTTSLQILESVQIADKSLMTTATHFNPVDLVCSITDAQGRHYNLTDFVDKNAGFISEKSQGGKTLRALELPGLWNGAMSRWNTVMVEVPTETFAPVKTLSDLLRPQHQPQDI